MANKNPNQEGLTPFDKSERDRSVIEGAKGGKQLGINNKIRKSISEIVQDMLHGKPIENHLMTIRKHYGNEVADGISNIEAMTLRQVEKSIQKGDTIAYRELVDRAEGKPISKTELTGKDGKDLSPPIINLIPAKTKNTQKSKPLQTKD